MKESRFLFRIFSAAAFVIGMTGCATSHKIKVDALARPAAENSIAYRIKTSNPGLDPKSLHHQEAERLVKTALSGKGLYEAPKPEMADIVIDLDYGIGPPKVTRESQRRKIYNTVPGRTPDDPPRRVYAGEQEHTITTVTYEKHLRISARSNTPPSEGRPPAEVWTVDVITEGKNRDLRKALPVLAAATIEYVGKDSRGQQTIRLKDTDDAIVFVKEGR